MLPVRAPRATAALWLATLLALLAPAVVLLPAASADAAGARTVSGGRLDWGVKASFQSYVTGPIAGGSWRLEDGAATVGESQFRFHSATGTYDPGTGAFRAGFSGAVHFLGHRASDGSYQLDLTIGAPTVRISGGSGTLYADMVSKAKGTGKVTSSRQVPLAALDLSGVDMRGATTPVALAHVPATLTARGATAFAGYYTEGTALDPVTLSVDTAAAAKTEPSTTPKTSAKPTEDTAKDGRFTDAAADWGVRRTYREYVTGPVAQGKWTLGDGARDGGALFRFPRGTGAYHPDAKGGGGLDARFTGSVRFTGKRGLDLTIARPSVTVADGKGTLYADVKGGALTRDHTPLVTFTPGELKPVDGLLRVKEAPAKLTADGAKAFGGLYPAGAAMDPVSLALALDADAALPALPDLGSDTASPAAAPEESPAAKPAASSGSSAPVGALVGGGAGAAVLVAVVVLLVVRARRGTKAPAD
ncbi:HtaA domain-containing protein [Streptomyces sp. NPDC050560]|uniref:HtaA domain-containing protein n=1 Tax=Streptomyces sp. NPDC050560 TaxID=3365630 RepID=UPI003794AEA8